MSTTETTAPEVVEVLAEDVRVIDLGAEMPLAQIVAGKNPRRTKDKAAQRELAESVKVHGVIQPIIVRAKGDGFVIVAGHRRYEAAKAAGLDTIPARVVEVDDQVAADLALVENLQRQDLDPLEESDAIAAAFRKGENAHAVARRMGKNVGYVARRANLSSLSKASRKTLSGGDYQDWGADQLELLAMVDAAGQAEILDRYDWVPGVEELRREIARSCQALSKAPWKIDDAELSPPDGACNVCPKQSANAPGLFDDVVKGASDPSKAVCRDVECWRRKLKIHIGRKVEAAQATHGDALVFVNAGGGMSGNDQKALPEGTPDPLSEWDYDRVKKGTKGAKPAVVVVGTGIGAQIWIKPKRTTSSRSTATKRTAGKAKPKPGTAADLKAKLERLWRRRAAWIVDQVKERLEAQREEASKGKAEHLDKLGIVPLLGMVAAYGSRSRSYDGVEGTGTRRAAYLKKQAAQLQEIWEGALSRCTPNLSRHNPSSLEKQHGEAVWLGDIVLGLTAKGLDAEAADAIPESKALATLARKVKGGDTVSGGARAAGSRRTKKVAKKGAGKKRKVTKRKKAVGKKATKKRSTRRRTAGATA